MALPICLYRPCNGCLTVTEHPWLLRNTLVSGKIPLQNYHYLQNIFPQRNGIVLFFYSSIICWLRHFSNFLSVSLTSIPGFVLVCVFLARKIKIKLLKFEKRKVHFKQYCCFHTEHWLSHDLGEDNKLLMKLKHSYLPTWISYRTEDITFSFKDVFWSTLHTDCLFTASFRLYCKCKTLQLRSQDDSTDKCLGQIQLLMSTINMEDLKYTVTKFQIQRCWYKIAFDKKFNIWIFMRPCCIH